MKLTPQQLQESFSKISEESFEKHMELAAIAERSGDAWLEIKATLMEGRDKNITNAEVDKFYATSEDGKREAFLKIYLKGLGHKRTAILSEIKANSNSTW